MAAYDSSRRTPRGRHRRVIKVGTERFAMNDADQVNQGFVVADSTGFTDYSDRRAPESKNAEDDGRILTELPPHWAVFSERE
ncbi:hypothetical protein GA0061078_0973 [Bifidobacterium bohemicum]|uniref:Uncharacterized protein n=1 Tax=Bifidobacterium bohemicum DSM 22767 TaxID=1437606 RepID=A0A086ZE82_9BIFI|nr:hypothetical protein [Bifidobacterium bohemicum]KFI44832.1 hypothetical protein BBOH_1561 [Bifidobacterium bohemicum DSM 22767]SCB95022.1 hypothetical protein GA0061078_0973 [Bifidobacterium bohemicum]